MLLHAEEKASDLSVRERPRRWRRAAFPTVQAFLLACDGLALAVAGLLVDARPGELLLSALLAGWLFQMAGLYRSRLTLSLLDDLPALTGRLLASVSVVLAGNVLLQRGTDRSLLAAAGLALPLVLLSRAGAYHLVTRLRSSGRVAHRTLVIGAGRVGGQVARLMLEHPSFGLNPVGFVDVEPLLSSAERELPLLGGQHDLARVIAEEDVAVVIIAFGSLPESDMVRFVRTCDRLDCEIFYVPRLFELQETGCVMDRLRGLPLVRLRRAPFRSLAWRLKRPVDVVVGGLALLLLAPLMALIALAVRLETGRGVLFHQERVGLDGRLFYLLKFRTYRPVSGDESDTRWSISGDARLGPVGRLLRRTSLDELPQLINVLRGEMSLVGPRPERPHFVSEFTRTLARYPDRHRVPVGVTGWAQVHGLRGNTSVAERAHFDNYYIENWSNWLDVKIVLRTVRAVLRREGS